MESWMGLGGASSVFFVGCITSSTAPLE